MVCAACGGSMNGGAKFCSNCGCAAGGQATGGQATGGRPWDGRKLERPLVGRKIAGVCAAIALYTGWDLTLIRLIAVIAAVCGVGMPVLAYIIGWAVMPNAPFVPMQGYAGSVVYPQGRGPAAS